MFRVIHPNRWFFWTITILLIVGLGLLFFVFQATREFEEQSLELVGAGEENPLDPSYQGWKVFRPEGLSVSIKYPPAWQIEIDPLQANSFYLEDPKKFGENISVAVVAPTLEGVIRASVSIAEEREIKVDGQSGQWLTSGKSDDPVLSNVVLVNFGGRLYYFAGQSVFFEKVIEGIKFLN